MVEKAPCVNCATTEEACQEEKVLDELEIQIFGKEEARLAEHR